MLCHKSMTKQWCVSMDNGNHDTSAKCSFKTALKSCWKPVECHCFLSFLLQVQEVVIDYTHCEPDLASVRRTYATCAEFVEQTNNTANGWSCTCTTNFTLEEDFAVGISQEPLEVFISENVGRTLGYSFSCDQRLGASVHKLGSSVFRQIDFSAHFCLQCWFLGFCALAYFCWWWF